VNRVILFHFHFFKNAGSAVDYILEKNFGDRFVKKEFKLWPYYENIKEVIKWIENESDAVAFSSHTARLFDSTLLERRGIKIIPIIFVRHPIIRIHSAYHYERKQVDIFRPGPVIARNTDFKGYVEIRLAIPRQEFNVSNFHVFRLADMLHGEKNMKPLEKALIALKRLPFIGLVEEFEKSMTKLEETVREYFPEFKASVIRTNVQFSPDMPLEERLKIIKNEVGKDFYKKLMEINEEDMVLWEKVVDMYKEGF